MFSVFSLTMQATLIQLCKETKVFKSQNQQSPISEEEEEKSNDGDESVDEEIIYLHTIAQLFYYGVDDVLFINHSELACCSTSIKIPIPPPKY